MESYEIDVLSAFLRADSAYRDQLCLPVVVEKNMPLAFRVYRDGDEMQASIVSKKLLEPKGTACQVTPTILLVPLLAFDPLRLTRLGYGGGYYDRTIEQLRHRASKTRLVTIGIALECLKCNDLPVETEADADLGSAAADP